MKEVAQSEWTLFDDAVVENKFTWEAVVNQCVEFNCYPTVLMFEKINETYPI